MNSDYPYVSTNYLSSHYKPQDLSIALETITADVAPYIRDEAEFWVVTAGTAEVEINGTAFQLTAGDVVQLMPHQIRRVSLAGETTLTMYAIRLSMGLLLLSSNDEKQYAVALRNAEHFFPVVHLAADSKTFLEQFCANAVLQKQHHPANSESLNLALTSYLIYLFHVEPHVAVSVSQDEQPWVWLRYLQFHHPSHLTLSGMAKVFETTAQELQAALIELTGFNFNQLLNQVRIRNAAGLMQFPELSIRKIAAICGYRTISTFYYQFEKINTVSPQAYRDALKTHHQLVGNSDGWTIGVYLFEHCAQPLTLPEVAQTLTYSEDTVNERLLTYFGQTFKPLLNQFRCEVARPLVLGSRLTFNQIAVRVGFQDSVSFKRNYQTTWQVTPRQDRQRNVYEVVAGKIVTRRG
ncbi:AraC family transcriptional regulator [Secundilactobacillus paracollinoides]|uniref:HTH araC/xylS-type domain-containing protein n=1 Tax=Secundilactobacillus paracollinoides TaxID=240427 RepID=A0A1B2IXC2_9LACO|nr:AraC family transcriptional regulator [Secundilactobacillus paracollinoides]ANZ60813.1 hypothetical protein AYR61_05295 [Secundilactobacillus paracollinoides]ANZ66658.1 hypothetical protein AYR63_05590 [Secundilactobacillus paracollinoides]